MTDWPPTTTSFRWCPVCGRDDRRQPFTGKSHYYRGKRCSGQPLKVVYGFLRIEEDSPN